MKRIPIEDVWSWIDDVLRRSDVRREEFSPEGRPCEAGVVLLEYGYRRAVDELIELLREWEEIPDPTEEGEQ